MGVLIAMEEDYKIYRGVMAAGLHAMRPHLQVATVGPDGFEERLRGFDPQIVISGGRAFPRSKVPIMCMDLAFDFDAPLRWPAEIWIGDSCRRIHNPDLACLLSLIDEVDQNNSHTSQRKGR